MSERGWKGARIARRYIGAGPALGVGQSDRLFDHPSKRPRQRHMWSGWGRYRSRASVSLDPAWRWLSRRLGDYTDIPF